MIRTIWTGTCATIIAGAAVAAMAQTPPAQQNTNPSADQKVTVTGCLRAAPPAGADAAATAGTTGTAATGTTGTAGAAGAAGTAGTAGTTGAATDSPDAKFVLADATMSPAKADTGSAPGTPATAAAAGGSSSAQPQTYQLIANQAALRPHVGKKLELTGTLVDQQASTSTGSTQATAAGPALKVEAGKVIAASCQE
jgi:pilus assembly protein FimV